MSGSDTTTACRNRSDALYAIKQHFEAKAPEDPTGAQARAFAKRSCNGCYGRGIIIKIKAGSKEGDPADMHFCACVRARLFAKADDMVRQKRTSYDG